MRINYFCLYLFPFFRNIANILSKMAEMGCIFEGNGLEAWGLE